MTETGKLGVGVIGVGGMGECHARVFSEIPTTELVAVADISKERARKIAERFQCDYYLNFTDLLKREDIQAVSIVTPDLYHVEQSIAAAEAGKHILLEKPIAQTVKEAEKIKKAADVNDVRLMIAHILRFDARYVQLHDQIEQGVLGDIIHIRAKRQSPAPRKRLEWKTSMFYYSGVHDIDLLLWYINGQAEEVYAKKVAKVTEEDCIFVLYSFRNGTVGTLEISWSLPNDFPASLWSEMEVVGTKGAGYVDIYDHGLKLFVNGPHFPDCIHQPVYNNQTMGDLRAELMHFVDAVLHDKEFLVSTNDAIRAIAFIEACQESIENGIPVKVRQ